MKMGTRSKLRIILPAIAAVVVVGIVVAFASYTTNTNSSDTNANKQIITGMIDSYTLDQLSKESDVIVAGTVSKVGPIQEVALPHDKIPVTLVTISVERELTGNYQSNEIIVTTLGGKENVVIADEWPRFTMGERVMLFLTHTKPPSVWGDAYMPKGAFQGKFTIDENGVAHNSRYGDIAVTQLIDQVAQSRIAN